MSESDIVNRVEAWNKAVEFHNLLTDYDEIMDYFVWGTDPFEKYDADILLNLNHLLGLILCRDTGVRASIQDTLSSRLKLTNQDPSSMSLRDLKDSVFNLQIEWPTFINQVPPGFSTDTIKNYLLACMLRFGELCKTAHPAETLNDDQDTERHDDSLRRVTSAAIRRMLGAFLLLLRHIDLYDLSEELAAAESPLETGVTKYHVEASMDHFHKICMHYFLPIAAKIQYKHDFPGMYNDVSQAVFFHNAEYKPIARLEETRTDPLHVLPSIHLMYPEIPIKFEDEVYNPLQAQGWYWLVIPRRIYLISPEPKVYYSTDISVLLHVYLRSKNTL